MSWVLAFSGFAALVVLHELGHFAAAKAVGMRVERFSLFFGPMLVKVRRGETEYGIGPIPLGGYVKITGMNPAEAIPPEAVERAYYRQPVWKRIVVIAAGPLVNVVLAFLILWGIYVVKGEPVDRASNTIAAVAAHQPAAGVLRPGDVVVGVDGHGGSLARLSDQIATHRCPGAQTPGCAAARPARITVRRDGTLRTFSLTPRYDASVQPPRARVGFAFTDRTAFLATDVPRAAHLSVREMWHVTSVTASTLGRVFYSPQARKQIHGIVGGYEATRQAFRFDTTQAVFILALISLSLAIFNLFPFLPLDGGHIFWAVAEKVRGRAISFSVMQRASVVGISLILFVAFVGLTNDLDTLQHGGFRVR